MKVFPDLERTTPDDVYEVVQQCITAAASWHVRHNSNDPEVDNYALNELLLWSRNQGYDSPSLNFDQPKLEELK